VENISLPPQVEKALDKRTEMGLVGDMNRFTQYQAATAIETAAANPAGGGSADAMVLGAGVAMGQKMAEAISPRAPTGGPGGGAPPPLPATAPRYFLGLGGQQVGPLDMNGLRQEIQQGRLLRSTLVWRDGMSSWEPAERVPEVSSLFPSAGSPPPLP
jgi:hypothetical protein